MADRFDAMRAFVAVCDAPGFAAAARRLALSPSAVTRLVGALEQRLGVRLLQRTTRSVKLTDAGARFLERTRRVLADLEEAELAAQEERASPRGLLVVAAPLLFGRIHVAPLVSRLLEEHPLASVDLQLSDRNVSLVEEGVDVAVRIGGLADSGLVARRLGATQRLVVASPEYLARRGTPMTPHELGGHTVIAFRAVGTGRRWAFTAPDGGAVEVDLSAHFSTNSGDAAINHAIAGGGITAALGYQVAEALRAGTLVEVLADHAPPAMPIHAVFPTSRLLSASVRAFLDIARKVSPGWSFLGAAAQQKASRPAAPRG